MDHWVAAMTCIVPVEALAPTGGMHCGCWFQVRCHKLVLA